MYINKYFTNCYFLFYKQKKMIVFGVVLKFQSAFLYMDLKFKVSSFGILLKSGQLI